MIDHVACQHRMVDLYFPSNTSVGGSMSLLKASAVLAKPR